MKEIKEGMVKPGSNGKITARNVLNIVPSFQAMPLKLLYVINDDMNAIEENMPIQNEVGESIPMS